ncbi:hypothetical protein [Halothece sp. PCC 7418]|uniref:hypothetical protein n=1 Tax=Halothece sp. (strain PCC 7418) TaxID=65093 RepID=UPI0003031564|nr:hypothetical protein [Halothece sp. PCC 7418]
MAIVLWIGSAIAIQSVTATTQPHLPAVIIGIMIGIAGWAAGIAKNGLRAAGIGNPERPFSEEVVASFQQNDTYITGAFALEQGLVFSAMILATMVVYIVERQFGKAAIWSLIAAALAWVGLIHSYQWTIGDTVIQLGWGVGAQWTIGYILVAIILFYVQWQHRSHL